MLTLREAFGIKPGEVISLVGGGGKTTLMFALAHELAGEGSVITTTTTRILEPSPADTPLLLIETDEDKVVKLVLEKIDSNRHLTVGSKRLASGKLSGISPELVVRIAGLEGIFSVIVEADGAAQRPLKAPNATEPVFPANTSLVIPVVGIDAVGCLLTEEKVFRAKIASQLLGLPPGVSVSSESVAILITHSGGIAKGSPERARIVPFINKMDLDGGLAKGKELARRILKISSRIKRVVLGQARIPETVVAVIAEEL